MSNNNPPPPSLGQHHNLPFRTASSLPSPAVGDGPDRVSLDAEEGICNAVQKGGDCCESKAVYAYRGYLPVCERHKEQQIAMGRCQHTDDAGDKCARVFKWKQPHPELCSAHRDGGTGLRFPLMALPSEVRMMIFSHVLPDKPISAYSGSPLRSDGTKCTTSVLLLNKQTSTEALEVLYRSHPFTINLTKEHFQLCGRIYPLPMDTETSTVNDYIVSELKPISMQSRIQAATPPLLLKIRSARLQTVFMKCSPALYQKRGFRTWSDEVEVYDLRDSIRYFTSMLLGAKTYALRCISLFCITQCLPGEWDDSQLLTFYHLISGPLRMLNNLKSASMEPLLHTESIAFERSQQIDRPDISDGRLLSHEDPPTNLTQYIPDVIQPWTGLPTSSSGESSLPPHSTGRHFVLPIPASTGQPEDPLEEDRIEIVLEARLHLNDAFTTLQSRFKAALTSPLCPVLSQNSIWAKRLFYAFQNSYYEVSSAISPESLPIGRQCYLHQARMARERANWLAIIHLHQRMKKEFHYWRELELFEHADDQNHTSNELVVASSRPSSTDAQNDEERTTSRNAHYHRLASGFIRSARDLSQAGCLDDWQWLIQSDSERLFTPMVRKHMCVKFYLKEFDILANRVRIDKVRADKALADKAMVDKPLTDDARRPLPLEQENSRKRSFQEMSES
jgi:hypothetical protein